MSEQAAQVIPSFWVEAVEPLRSFFMEKLGFGHMMGVVGKDGNLDFAIVTRDGINVMMGRPENRMEGIGPKATTDRPVEIYMYVGDVDAYHKEITGRGVTAVEKLETQWWGDRTFAVKDPYGYKIWFCQTVGEVKPPPGVNMI